MQSAGGSRNRGGAAAEPHADLLIVGGGTGGCAAALAATSLGLQVVMTEETDWIGGQLTSQMVPPDESPWIEGQGCTARYRRYRDAVRQYYRDHYPLTPAARADPFLNPGQGTVSRLCHEPRVGVAVLEQLLDGPAQAHATARFRAPRGSWTCACGVCPWRPPRTETGYSRSPSSSCTRLHGGQRHRPGRGGGPAPL